MDNMVGFLVMQRHGEFDVAIGRPHTSARGECYACSGRRSRLVAKAHTRSKRYGPCPCLATNTGCYWLLLLLLLLLLLRCGCCCCCLSPRMILTMMKLHDNDADCDACHGTAFKQVRNVSPLRTRSSSFVCSIPPTQYTQYTEDGTFEYHVMAYQHNRDPRVRRCSG